ncbi:MAG: hypothetical protein ACR2G2_19765 [Pseudonocardia sp.]
MASWTISRVEPPAELASGAEPSPMLAWDAAITEALQAFGDGGGLDRCAFTVDSHPAFLVAGRTHSGELDLPATRAAAERMAAAILGVADLSATPPA